MFRGWYTIAERCEACELVYEPNDGDTWAFMYVSTAGITGVFILLMMFGLKPSQLWIGRSILLPAALLAIVATLPRRKGIALALDYLSELLLHRTAKINDGTPPELPEKSPDRPEDGK